MRLRTAMRFAFLASSTWYSVDWSYLRTRRDLPANGFSPPERLGPEWGVRDPLRSQHLAVRPLRCEKPLSTPSSRLVRERHGPSTKYGCNKGGKVRQGQPFKRARGLGRARLLDRMSKTLPLGVGRCNGRARRRLLLVAWKTRKPAGTRATD